MFISNYFKKIISNEKLFFSILGTILIVVFGITLTFSLTQYLDIEFVDEAFYMHRGRFFGYIYIEPQNGAFYSIWYKMISFFESDSISLYYLNWKITIVLPAILLFLILTQVGLNAGLSFAFAIFFMYSDVNFITWPRISHFCICILALGLLLSKRAYTNFSRYLILAYTSLLASYIRPEFFIPCLLFMLIMAFYYLKGRFKISTKEKVFTLSFLLLLILLKTTYGWPMLDEKEDRSTQAFSQYYALNYFNVNHISLNPWTDHQSYFKEAFGDAHSILEVIVANPNQFFNHVLINSKSFGKTLYLGFQNFYFPNAFFHIKLVFGVFLLGTCLIILINYLTIRDRDNYFRINNFARSIIIPILVFSIPSLISCVVLFPREHYYFLLLIPIITFLGILMSFIKIDILSNFRVKCLLLGIVTIILLFSRPTTASYFVDRSTVLGNKEAALAIRKLNIKSEVNILENEGGINTFLTPNFNIFLAFYKQEPYFKDYYAKNKINLIWVTEGLINDSRFANDSSWTYFVKNYELFDFEKQPLRKGYLLVKKPLLVNPH